MLSLIRFNNVTKIYQTGETALRALNSVDLSIKKNELVGIVGVSGSGKSTMMNIIGLLDTPTSGTFTFSGKDVSSFNENQLAEIRNKKIGFVFQSFFLLARLNAIQNVTMPLLYRGISSNIAKKQASQMLEKLKIGHLGTHKPNQMSGGEQQRVAISRALIGEPDIILADEPTGSLDSKTGHEIIDLFIKLNKDEGKTIIIVTHDLNVAKQCKRIITLKDGQIITDKKHALKRTN